MYHKHNVAFVNALRDHDENTWMHYDAAQQFLNLLFAVMGLSDPALIMELAEDDE